MKDLVSFSMILTVMLGFVGVGRLCWDSKWFVLLLFLYSLGALATLGMVYVINNTDGVYGGNMTKPRTRPDLQLRPNEREWIVRGGQIGTKQEDDTLKNTPLFRENV